MRNDARGCNSTLLPLRKLPAATVEHRQAILLLAQAQTQAAAANASWLARAGSATPSHAGRSGGTDGYTGCPRIGEKWAIRALEPVHQALRDASPGDHLAGLWSAVVAAYERKKLVAEDALIQARLSRILRLGNLDYKNCKVKL